MKKILAGTTALVAAAVVAGQAQAADPIKLELGGFMTQYVGYVDNEEASATDENYAEVYTGADTEVYFRGSTTLDNGLTVSVNIDMEGDRNATSQDDVFMAISSDSLGTIEIGATKSVAYDMAILAPVGGVGLNDSDFGYFTNGDFLGVESMDRIGTLGSDGQKINYYSPNLFGVQIGLTYGLLPDSVNGGSLDLANNNDADYVFGAGIAYSGEIAGIGLGASVTALREFAGGAGGIGGNTNSDESTITAGAEISVAGFTIGGGYTYVDNFEQTHIRDFESYDIGVSYATGPYTISAGYQEFEDENTIATTDDDNTDAFVAAVDYDLGAGISASASVYSVENENGVNGTDREAFGIVAGISASF